MLIFCASAAFLAPASRLLADAVSVRYTEGEAHGFLVLRSLSGQILADGDLMQVARGDKVTSKVVFRFRDGSYQEETAVFSQSRYFRLLTDHLVQKGPAFPHPLDMSIDAERQNVTVRYTDDDGKEKVADEGMELPADLANGIITILLKNVPADLSTATLSIVAATPKPRLVKLAIKRSGQAAIANGKSSHTASRFEIKVELGGLTGVVAPLVGKQPPDSYVWILGGEAPAFLRSEAPLYSEGPVRRIELTSPTWPRPAASKSKQ